MLLERGRGVDGAPVSPNPIDESSDGVLGRSATSRTAFR